MSTPFFDCSLTHFSNGEIFRQMIYRDADGNLGIGVVVLSGDSIFPRETVTVNLTAGVTSNVLHSLNREARIIQMYDNTGEQVTPELFLPVGNDTVQVRVSVTGAYVINIIAF